MKKIVSLTCEPRPPKTRPWQVGFRRPELASRSALRVARSHAADPRAENGDAERRSQRMARPTRAAADEMIAADDVDVAVDAAVFKAERADRPELQPAGQSRRGLRTLRAVAPAAVAMIRAAATPVVAAIIRIHRVDPDFAP